MKKILIILLFSLFLGSCATVQSSSPFSSMREGLKTMRAVTVLSGIAFVAGIFLVGKAFSEK